MPALALASALCSAWATILIRQGLGRYGPSTGFWINLVVGTAGLWVAVPLTGGVGTPSARGVVFFILAGLIGTMAGRLLRFVSIETVGTSITAALMNLSPLVSSVLAIVLLGERLTLPIAVGTLVVVTGTTLVSSGGVRLGVRPRRLVLPVLSAVCFGVVAILRKVGVVDTGPIVGFAVNVTAALVAFTAFLLASGQQGTMVCRGRSLAYFLAAGVAENLAVFLTVVALGLGTVSVVAPLASVTPVFVLLLSAVFLRGVEVVNRWVVGGSLLTVVGVWALTALGGR